MISVELRIKLAEIQHEIWSHWMKFMFENGGIETVRGDGNRGAEKIWMIKPSKEKRWRRQMNTPYAKLTDEEKRTDQNVVVEHGLDVLIEDIGERIKREVDAHSFGFGSDGQFKDIVDEVIRGY